MVQRLRGLRAWSNPVVVTCVLVALAVVVFGLGHLTAAPAAPRVAKATAVPTATPLIPTPTPSLVLRAPHVLAAYTVSSDELTNDMYTAYCGQCDSLTFTSNGPFFILASCATSLDNRVELRLLDAGGHITDDLEHVCHGSSAAPEATTTFTVPENQPAGNYTLRIIWSGSIIALSLVVLDAAPQTGAGV